MEIHPYPNQGRNLPKIPSFYMHNLLSKLFQKKGIDSVENLEKEERTIFDNYEKILSKRELTVEEIKIFLQQQIGIIETKWRDYDIAQIKKAELLPYHTVYKSILGALTAPEQERSALEKYLIQLLQT